MSARFYFAWRLCEAARAQDERNFSNLARAKARASGNALTNISEREFRNRYRLSKKAFKFLCEELRTKTGLKSSQRVTLEDMEAWVLTALFFFVSGSYQRPVGVARNLSQKMCSVYIHEVTEALTHRNMLNTYIKFPESPEARQAISERFYSKYKIPGVIGCIDGSHFRIFGPLKSDEHRYYCRKHYYSINVQMICDDEYRILHVNPKYGGQTHDTFIWENSKINSYMQSLHRNGELVWLLGDSGYPQRPWMMTPFSNPRAGLETRYIERHMSARVVIENTFGRLKNRWRCLNKDRVLHYRPLKCAKIIQACCVLHNLFIDQCTIEEIDDQMGIDLPSALDVQEEIQQSAAEDANIPANDLIRGRVRRDQLVRRMI